MSFLAGYLVRGLEEIVPGGVKDVIKGALPNAILRPLQGAKAASMSGYEKNSYQRHVEEEKQQSAVAKGFDTITKGITEASLFPPETLENPLSAKGLTSSIRKKLDEESGIYLILQNGCLNTSLKSIQEVQSFFEAHYVSYYTALQNFIANIEDPYFKALKNRLDPIDVFALNAILAERKPKPSYEIELAKKSKFGHVLRVRYKTYDYLLLFFSIPLHVVFQSNGTFLPEYQAYLDLKQQMKQKGLEDIQVYNQGLLDAYVQQQEREIEEQQRRNRLAQEERDRQYALQRQQAERERQERERAQQAKYDALSTKSKQFVKTIEDVKRNLPGLLKDEIVIRFVEKFKGRKALGEYYLEGAEILSQYGTNFVQLNPRYIHRFILLMASFITAYRPALLVDFLNEINRSRESIQNWTNFENIASIVKPVEEYLYPAQMQQDRIEQAQKEARKAEIQEELRLAARAYNKLQQQQRMQQYGRYGGGSHVTKKQKKKARTKTHKH